MNAINVDLLARCTSGVSRNAAIQNKFCRILVPINGIAEAYHAATAAIALAKLTGGRIFAVDVVVPRVPDMPIGGLYMINGAIPTAAVEINTMPNEENPKLRAVEEMALLAGVPVESSQVIGISEASGIIETAQKNNCDLIVMTSHSHSRVIALLTGDTPASVFSNSKVPMLLVH